VQFAPTLRPHSRPRFTNWIPRIQIVEDRLGFSRFNGVKAKFEERPFWVTCGIARAEHNGSALPRTADIRADVAEGLRRAKAVPAARVIPPFI